MSNPWLVLAGGLVLGACPTFLPMYFLLDSARRRLGRTWRDGYEEGAQDEHDAWMALPAAPARYDVASYGWEPAPTDRIAIHARYYETPAPLPPPRGAGQIPPGSDEHTRSSRDTPMTPEPGGTGSSSEPYEVTGPAPDPIFAALDDTGAFEVISFELGLLKLLASEPFRLTEWGSHARSR